MSLNDKGQKGEPDRESQHPRLATFSLTPKSRRECPRLREKKKGKSPRSDVYLAADSAGQGSRWFPFREKRSAPRELNSFRFSEALPGTAFQEAIDGRPDPRHVRPQGGRGERQGGPVGRRGRQATASNRQRFPSWASAGSVSCPGHLCLLLLPPRTSWTPPAAGHGCPQGRSGLKRVLRALTSRESRSGRGTLDRRRPSRSHFLLLPGLELCFD